METIIKQEQLKFNKGILNIIKGDLTLTDENLSFDRKGKLYFSIPINQIVNVHSKKAFSAGEDQLEIDYLLDGEKKHIYLSRFSLAQWSSSANSIGKGGLMGRLESNSLAGWEEAINKARQDLKTKNKSSVIDDLEKLFELKEKGVITEEEFVREKKKMLENTKE